MSESAVDGLFQQHRCGCPGQPPPPPAHLLQVDVNDKRTLARHLGQRLWCLRCPCSVVLYQRLRGNAGSARWRGHVQAAHWRFYRHSWRKPRYYFNHLNDNCSFQIIIKSMLVPPSQLLGQSIQSWLKIESILLKLVCCKKNLHLGSEKTTSNFTSTSWKPLLR